MRVTMRRGLGLALLAGMIAACETSIDPQTGQTTTWLTLPGTAANEASAQRRWQQCAQFRSESYCTRTIPGGRPGQPGQAVVEQTPQERDDP